VENRRYTWFAISIGVGLILGLILGWSVLPRKAKEMPLNDLRMDYKTDYVLMVATIYQKDLNYGDAQTRLEYLGEDIEKLVKDAVDFANVNYSGTMDLQALTQLLQVVMNGQSSILSGRAVL